MVPIHTQPPLQYADQYNAVTKTRLPYEEGTMGQLVTFCPFKLLSPK